jgi:hypothetical protein
VMLTLSAFATRLLGTGVISALGGVLTFLGTPLGQVIAVAAALFGAYVAGDLHGHHEVSVEWKAAVARQAQESKAREEAARAEAAADAKTRADQLAAENADLEQQVKDYAKKLAANGNCALSDDDARSLRQLGQQRRHK